MAEGLRVAFGLPVAAGGLLLAGVLPVGVVLLAGVVAVAVAPVAPGVLTVVCVVVVFDEPQPLARTAGVTIRQMARRRGLSIRES
jgi:hypothetical protein